MVGQAPSMGDNFNIAYSLPKVEVSTTLLADVAPAATITIGNGGHVLTAYTGFSVYVNGVRLESTQWAWDDQVAGVITTTGHYKTGDIFTLLTEESASKPGATAAAVTAYASVGSLPLIERSVTSTGALRPNDTLSFGGTTLADYTKFGVYANGSRLLDADWDMTDATTATITLYGNYKKNTLFTLVTEEGTVSLDKVLPAIERTYTATGVIAANGHIQFGGTALTDYSSFALYINGARMLAADWAWVSKLTSTISVVDSYVAGTMFTLVSEERRSASISNDATLLANLQQTLTQLKTDFDAYKLAHP
jgi:hypothetical protein